MEFIQRSFTKKSHGISEVGKYLAKGSVNDGRHASHNQQIVRKDDERVAGYHLSFFHQIDIELDSSDVVH